MSAFPDFTAIAFDGPAAAAAAAPVGEPWTTPEGIAVRPPMGPPICRT